jgi:hypothetical protein
MNGSADCSGSGEMSKMYRIRHREVLSVWLTRYTAEIFYISKVQNRCFIYDLIILFSIGIRVLNMITVLFDYGFESVSSIDRWAIGCYLVTPEVTHIQVYALVSPGTETVVSGFVQQLFFKFLPNMAPS